MRPQCPKLVRDAALASCILGLFRVSPLVVDIWMLLCRAITTSVGLMSFSDVRTQDGGAAFGVGRLPFELIRLAVARVAVLGSFG
eukprot:12926320-Prorocentrum_lima.AAC.1